MSSNMGLRLRGKPNRRLWSAMAHYGERTRSVPVVIVEREASNGMKLPGIVRSLRAEVVHLSNARSEERSEGRKQDRAMHMGGEVHAPCSGPCAAAQENAGPQTWDCGTLIRNPRRGTPWRGFGPSRSHQCLVGGGHHKIKPKAFRFMGWSGRSGVRTAEIEVDVDVLFDEPPLAL